MRESGASNKFPSASGAVASTTKPDSRRSRPAGFISGHHQKQQTKEQIELAIYILRAVADAIKELGQVNEGILYARLSCGRPAIDLPTFNRIIDQLVELGIVTKEPNYILKWQPPKHHTPGSK